MITFLRLIRITNLFIIAITMYMVRYCIIIPVFTLSENLDPAIIPGSLLNLRATDFSLLVLATVLIAAAGNIINDIFDIDADTMNDPDHVIVGKLISKRSAIIIYIVFTVAGLLLGSYASFKAGVLSVFMIVLFAAVSLFMYSWNLKRTFLAGNILVALLSALITVLPAAPEKEFYINMQFILYFTAFAFLLSLIRELIKDIEDRDGDEASGCYTLPIAMGDLTARRVAVLLEVGLLGFVLWVLDAYFFSNSVLSFGNLATLALLPFGLLIFLTVKARIKADYSRISFIIKVIMLCGVLSMYPFYYFFLRP